LISGDEYGCGAHGGHGASTGQRPGKHRV